MMLWNEVNVTKMTVDEMAEMVTRCKEEMLGIQGILCDIQQTLELRVLPKDKKVDGKEFLGILDSAGDSAEEVISNMELLVEDLELLSDYWIVGTVIFRDQPEDKLAVLDGEPCECVSIEEDGDPDRVDS